MKKQYVECLKKLGILRELIPRAKRMDVCTRKRILFVLETEIRPALEKLMEESDAQIPEVAICSRRTRK